MSDNQTTLDIIATEIEELKVRSKDGGLSFAETKKLETLIKIRNLIYLQPTEIVRNEYDDQFTDKEVLKFLQDNIKDAAKKKISRKRAKSKTSS